MTLSKMPEKFQVVFFGGEDFYRKIFIQPAVLKNIVISYAQTIDDLRRILKGTKAHILFLDQEDSSLSVAKLSEILAIDYPGMINIAVIPSQENVSEIYSSIEEGFIHFYVFKNAPALEFQIMIKLAIKKFCDSIITQELIYKVKTYSQKLEEEVKKKTLQLEEIIQEKKNYFNFIVHELKGPLTAVKGAVEVLEDFENLSQNQKNDFLSMISFHYQEILRMVNSILDFSRSQDYEMELNLRPFSLNHLFAKIEKVFRIIAQKKKIELIFKNPESPLEIRGDEDKLDMAFSNLIYNAIKYTDQGSVKVFYEKDSGSVSDTVLFYVKDTGRGIERKEIRQIFDLYRRGKSSENIPGTGIGLYFTKNIIEAHGGKIWCESEGEDKGSSFFVRLPALKKACP